MKRILSMLLAVVMVLSTTVMAAPFQVSTVETAKEASSATDDDVQGELEGTVSYTVKPGINILTGTTAPLTGENAAMYGSLNVITPNTSKTFFTVADNPDDATDKVLCWNIPTGIDSDYYSLEWVLPDNLEKLVGHNYAHMKYDFNKVVNFPTDGSTYSYRASNSAWIMHDSGSTNDVVTTTDIAANTGWKNKDMLLNFLAKTQGNEATGTKFAKAIRLQVQVNNKTTYKDVVVNEETGETTKVVNVQGNTVPTDIYFDNMMMVPAYEFKLVNPSNDEVIKKVYKAFDDNGEIITSYAPEAGLYGSYYIPSWTTVKGGAPVESIALNNENVTLYATSIIPAITVTAEGQLSDVGTTMTLTPVVTEALKDELSVARGNWAIADPSIATISKNKNGSAKVTAVSGGKTTATFTIGNVSVTYDVEVVLPYELDVKEIKNGKIYTLNPADYTAMIVTLSNAKPGDNYTLYYEAGGESGEFKLAATTTEKRDYYIDLTKANAWSESKELALQFEGSATVESIKLYGYFDPSFELEIPTESVLLTKPGEELVLSAEFTSALEGVYDEGYTLTVTDENDVVSCKIDEEEGTVLLRAKVATGIVTVTATSKEDPTYSVSKDIYVNVDSAKYGMYYDFLEAASVAEAGISRLADNGVGHTDVAIKDGMLNLSRPTTDLGTGGICNTDNTLKAPATQKYFIVNTTSESKIDGIYYKWDNNAHAEANHIYPTSNGCLTIDNGDGTKTYIFYMANIPETAESMTGFMMTIPTQSTADVICMYTTSIKPDIKPVEEIKWTWDFSTNTFTASQNQLLTEFNGETMKATKVLALINGAETAVQITGYETLADGTEVIRLSTDKGTHGSLSPKAIPQNTKLEEYPYMWFKYRSNASVSGKLYLMDTDKGGNEGGWDSKFISFPKSEEYTTLVAYLPDYGFGAGLNTVLTSMMFPIQAKTVFDDVQKDDKGYYVPKNNYKATVKEWIEFDEITFANYNPFADEEENEIPLEMVVTVNGTTNEITEDSGSANFYATVFANKEISTDAVTWSVDGGNVTVRENEDGSITVKAVSNGTVKITATSMEDSSFKGSFTLKVSGQRNKIAAYDFNYLAIGNSYCKHGYNANYSIWLPADKPARGMAASEPDLDYFHRVQHYLTTELRGTMKADRIASSTTENVSENETSAEIAKEKLLAESNFNTIRNYILDEKPNIITIQLSENFGGKGVVERTFYDVLYGMIDECRTENSVVVVITPFGGASRINVIKEFAAKYGFYVADMGDVESYSVVDLSKRYFVKDGVTYDRGNNGWKYNPYLAWEQYPAYDNLLGDGRAEFRSHPGDLGMDLIGQRVFAQLEKAVPAFLDAEYIYVPTAFEITGGNEITTLGGTLNLTAVPAEEDAANDVVWTVDDDKFATIDENGVLTAKINGKVTVKATSAYDSSVYAELVVTITGQADVYTLTYDAGTKENVTDMPANDDFATGEYTLSSIIPARTGYKFLGWSLSKNGETVKSVNVTTDTTVYAVWALAEGWHFDKDDDNEGISFGGFNVVVKDGIGTVLSYDEGVTIFDSTLKLDSENYEGFNVRMDLSGTEEENLKLALEITTDVDKYTYSKDISAVGEQLLYTFDISNVEGTITGFSLRPSAMMCQANVDWIEFVRTSLNRDASVDKVTAVYDYAVNANGYTFEIDTLDIADGCTVVLENGNFVIANVTGNGEIVTDGNLTYTGETALEGYVSIETGMNPSYANLTFAEVDGYQYRYNGHTFGLIVPEGETKLVQLVEKHAEDAVTMLASKYFKVTADGAEEITSLTNSIDNEEEVSLRVTDPVGVRFKAGIANTAKADAVVKEYGFVIALARDLVNSGEQLTLDFNKIATGSAYISGTDTDKIFETDDITTFFTGVLYGIPEDSYGVRLVSKTFMKLDVDGEEFVVYGEPITASAYEIAKELKDSDELSDEAKAVVDNIIDCAENGDDVGFDYGDLAKM